MSENVVKRYKVSHSGAITVKASTLLKEGKTRDRMKKTSEVINRAQKGSLKQAS